MKYSRIVLLALTLLWFLLPLATKGKIIFIGFITLYLAFHNYIGLRLALTAKTTINKLDRFASKFGAKWGPRIYLIIFVFFPLAIGLYIIISGLTLP